MEGAHAAVALHQLHAQQVECLLTLAEELHFGRTAARLGVSQSRVSQLIAGLERDIGARLVDRTSRHVAMTRFGAEVVTDLRPSYEQLIGVLNTARRRAKRGGPRELRVGFQGSVYEEVTEAFRRLRAHDPVAIVLSEIPLGSPFSALLSGEVDCAIVQLPVREAGLSVGFAFPPQDRFLAVGNSHPFANRERIDVEELEAVDLAAPAGTFAPLGIVFVFADSLVGTSSNGYQLFAAVALIVTAIINPEGIAGRTRQDLAALRRRLHTRFGQESSARAAASDPAPPPPPRPNPRL